MPQHTRFEDTPAKDIENLDTMVNLLLQYAIIHEDLVNQIEETMKVWAIQQPEFQELLLNNLDDNDDELKKIDFNDINEDNYGDFLYTFEEFELMDMWRDVEQFSEEFARDVVSMYRNVIAESIYSDHYASNIFEFANEVSEYL